MEYEIVGRYVYMFVCACVYVLCMCMHMFVCVVYVGICTCSCVCVHYMHYTHFLTQSLTEPEDHCLAGLVGSEALTILLLPLSLPLPPGTGMTGMYRLAWLLTCAGNLNSRNKHFAD